VISSNKSLKISWKTHSAWGANTSEEVHSPLRISVNNFSNTVRFHLRYLQQQGVLKYHRISHRCLGYLCKITKQSQQVLSCKQPTQMMECSIGKLKRTTNQARIVQWTNSNRSMIASTKWWNCKIHPRRSSQKVELIKKVRYRANQEANSTLSRDRVLIVKIPWNHWSF